MEIITGILLFKDIPTFPTIPGKMTNTAHKQYPIPLLSTKELSDSINNNTKPFHMELIGVRHVPLIKIRNMKNINKQ